MILKVAHFLDFDQEKLYPENILSQYKNPVNEQQNLEKKKKGGAIYKV